MRILRLLPALALILSPVPAAAATCFSLGGPAHCGQTYPMQKDTLPATILQAAAACERGFLYSPWGCALADGRVPLGVSRGDAPAGDYFAWLATGDLFACPASGAPTAGAGCTFFFRTIDGWDMAGTFSAAALRAAVTCPVPLRGQVTAGGRIAVTIGIGTGGGFRPEPAIVDTGSPDTYVLASQLQGWRPAGPLGRILFPLWGDLLLPDTPYTGTLAVLDGPAWVSLGRVTVQGIQGPVGDGLGMDALRGGSLQVGGGTWTLNFPCGGGQ
jgi:hypothetical protein